MSDTSAEQDRMERVILETVLAMTMPGKAGLLAADESSGTMGKRLAALGLENTSELRESWRRVAFTAPRLSKYISGVILYSETLYDHTVDGTESFGTHLTDLGIVPGIKLDLGLRALPGFPGEFYTQGLTDLDLRATRAFAAGARFAKWRTVTVIDPASGAPSETAIRDNAATLAKYAAICIRCGLVPIVEPEVFVLDGSHSLAVSRQATERQLTALYKALADYRVRPELTVLKINFVVPSRGAVPAPAAEDVAKATAGALLATVPPGIGGIFFLSGGLTEAESTRFLQATVQLLSTRSGASRRPWPLLVSYGRALQKSALDAWKGVPANAEAAQTALLRRAALNTMATLGRYTSEDAQVNVAEEAT